MPANLSFLTKPIVKWIAIGGIVLGLYLWGQHHSNLADSYAKDVIIKEQTIDDLEQSLIAEKKKAEQREKDAEFKQRLIADLSIEKLNLHHEYVALQNELNDLLTNVIPNIKTEKDLVEAKKVVEQAVTVSFGCIEAATKGEPCEN